MQSVNDDMDELWRKAGAEYPLNTGSADWEKMAARLGIPPEPDRKDRRYLWLLLLLLIPVVCMRPFPLGLGGENSVVTSRQEGRALKPAGSLAPAGAPQEPVSTRTQPLVPVTGSSSGTPPASTPASAGTTAPVNRISTVAPAAAATPEPSQQPPVSLSSLAATKPSIARGARQPAVRRKGSSRPSRTAMPAAALPLARHDGRNRPSRKGQPAPDTDPDSATQGRINTVVAQVPVQTPATPAAPVSKVPSAADSLSENAPAAVAPDATPGPASQKKKPQLVHSPRLYAGVAGGIGITTVKGQKAGTAGYDLGVAVGYGIGRHFAVEAQVLWSRKHYYSDGKYLKSSPGYQSSYYSVRSVNGDCRMVEIPVSVHYHFGFRNHGNWFASAGMSSYLMKREEYAYTVHNNFTNYDVHYDSTYRNATHDWAAVLQLSAGYRFSLPRQFSFRVEPYVQLPLRVAGAGRLPLTSMGLRVALVKPIF